MTTWDCSSASSANSNQSQSSQSSTTSSSGSGGSSNSGGSAGSSSTGSNTSSSSSSGGVACAATGAACTTSSGCCSGLYCYNGTCQADPGTCTGPDQCPSGDPAQCNNNPACIITSQQSGAVLACCEHGCLPNGPESVGNDQVRRCLCAGEGASPQNTDHNDATGGYCQGAGRCCGTSEYCCGSNCCANGCDPNDPSRCNGGSSCPPGQRRSAGECECPDGSAPCGLRCCTDQQICGDASTSSCVPAAWNYCCEANDQACCNYRQSNNFNDGPTCHLCTSTGDLG